MKNIVRIFRTAEATIRDAITTIDSEPERIVLIVDKEQRLIGTATDGDIRRGMLAGYCLDDPVSLVMNATPESAGICDDSEGIDSHMQRMKFRHMPIIDEAGRVVDVRLLLDFDDTSNKPNTVVLMAGGLGSRLRPLTDNQPKPLLPVGNRPILETIIKGFIDHGFSEFVITVNYKAEMVSSYFDDGSRWGVNIGYLKEDQPLGTAGALSLLPSRPKEPFIVMNGDILTKVNFENLLQFHHESNAVATIAVRQYDFRVPFGVIETEGHRLKNIAEKPIHEFIISAGMYVLNPEVLDLIPPEQATDMPTVLENLVAAGKEVSTFLIREYWIDIGRIDDFQRAKGDFNSVFDDES